jgi:hypothetical protein
MSSEQLSCTSIACVELPTRWATETRTIIPELQITYYKLLSLRNRLTVFDQENPQTWKSVCLKCHKARQLTATMKCQLFLIELVILANIQCSILIRCILAFILFHNFVILFFQILKFLCSLSTSDKKDCTIFLFDI